RPAGHAEQIDQPTTTQCSLASFSRRDQKPATSDCACHKVQEHRFRTRCPRTALPVPTPKKSVREANAKEHTSKRFSGCLSNQNVVNRGNEKDNSQGQRKR